MDIKQRIETAKAIIEKGNRAKTTAEAQLEMANAQVEETKGKLANLGVTPDNATEELAKIDKQMSDDMDKIEALLPNL